MPSQSQILTGYYRYNDIWFQWSTSLHPEDGAIMRGLFAHDSLVHPNHPFNANGTEGVQIWHATLKDGEERLLFSSAQVNYIRYWLYKMGLTKKIIPLPYSDCLLTKEDLPFGVIPRFFKTGGDLKAEQKKLDKVNKAIRRKGKTSANRTMFQYTRDWWASKKATWLAIDIECWDRMHDVLLEFGWSATYWNEAGEEVEERGHFRVEEEINTRQTFVESHPDKYEFGTTELVKRKLQVKSIQDIIARYRARGLLVLVFHDHRGDTRFLTQIGALEPWKFLQRNIPETGLFVADTQLLFMALEAVDGGTNERSLKWVCNQLQIPTKYLHNAGNDAHYTILALKLMASGDEIDIQRSTRWPSNREVEDSDDIARMGFASATDYFV